MEISKVLERKDKVKMAIIPKKSKIKKDDYIAYIKIDPREVEKNVRRS